MKDMVKLDTSARNQALCQKHRRALLATQTHAELHVGRLLTMACVEHIPQKGFFHASSHFIVDFYLKRHGKLCLELDGAHHNNLAQAEYDKARDNFLTKVRGFRVIRLSNQYALSLDKEMLLEVIQFP